MDEHRNNQHCGFEKMMFIFKYCLVLEGRDTSKSRQDGQPVVFSWPILLISFSFSLCVEAYSGRSAVLLVK